SHSLPIPSTRVAVCSAVVVVVVGCEVVVIGGGSPAPKWLFSCFRGKDRQKEFHSFRRRRRRLQATQSCRPRWRSPICSTTSKLWRWATFRKAMKTTFPSSCAQTTTKTTVHCWTGTNVPRPRGGCCCPMRQRH
ncbi:AGAP009345-PA, partial [Anopheles gambiae str. PEST]